jgi:hypothetical protein
MPAANVLKNFARGDIQYLSVDEHVFDPNGEECTCIDTPKGTDPL